MKKKKEYLESLSAVIPKLAPNLNELVKDTKISSDRLRVLLHQIYVVWVEDELNDERRKNYFHAQGWVTLHSSRLRPLLTTEKCNDYINFLEEKRIIEVTRTSVSGGKSYHVAKRATGYRINPRLLPKRGRKFRIEKITGYRELKAIYRDMQNHQKQEQVFYKSIKLAPIHIKLQDMLSEFKFETDKVDLFLQALDDFKITLKRETNNGVFAAHYIPALFNEGRANKVSVDSFGFRFHSTLSRIPKEYRYFIKTKDGEGISCVDLANSQPYFLALILCFPDQIKKLLPEFSALLDLVKTIPAKRKRIFLEFCTQGKIYDIWQTYRGQTRNEAKQEIIESILFSKTTYKRSKHELPRLLFECLFPDVWMGLEKIKQANESIVPFIENTYFDKYGKFGGKKFNFKNASCLCQRIESKIFIGIISRILVKRGIGSFFTAHDSIFIATSKIAEVKQVIETCFEGLGLRIPTLKIESYEAPPFKI